VKVALELDVVIEKVPLVVNGIKTVVCSVVAFPKVVPISVVVLVFVLEV
jgi:hypothetical protein